MPSVPRVRAFVLLVLLAGGSLLALVPPAASQAAAVLCFDVDERPLGATCSPQGTADYLEGGPVAMTVDGIPPGSAARISVRCVQGCPSTDPSATALYYATYRGADEPVVFPRDFIEPGPGDGGSAVADRAPRYNSTWEVSAGFDGTSPLARQFRVWLYDAMVGTNETVRPGESRFVRATGFDAGVNVSYRIERRTPEGAYEVLLAPRVRAAASGPGAGTFETELTLAKAEAGHILTCGIATADCYRIVVSGAGKDPETVPMRVGVADIRRDTATTPRQPAGQLPAMQRTQNASFDVDLRYPGGRVRAGPALVEADVPESFTFGGRALRVAVERVHNANGTAYLVDEVPLRYDTSRFTWRAQWTIPKDLDVSDAGVHYRLRLVEQRDVYGNRVPEDVLGNFTVALARLRPVLDLPFRSLERTAEGVVRAHILYYNGSRFTLDDAPLGNESPVRGCFVRVPDPPPEPAPPAQAGVTTCAGRDLAWGRYYDGAWNFSVRYPRDYEDLAGHRFLFQNGTRDRWGNEILPASTDAFDVTPARPDVVFSTVARGRETDVFERGNRVFISATITYHDGSPYNHSVRVNPDHPESLTLAGALVRRGPAVGGAQYGPIASEEPFNLTETDPWSGRWGGFLPLSDDDTQTPVGTWTFRFDIRDNLTVPNANLSLIDREVVSAIVEVCPTWQPPARANTSATLRFRFQLYYSDCASGREVPTNVITSGVVAHVRRYNPGNATTYGPPLSGALLPTYSGETRDWGLQYEIPDALYEGTYAFAVSGGDTYGNRIARGAASRPFATYADFVQRDVLTPPAVEVLRGDSAVAVFDAREGDQGVDVRRSPNIALERFDPSSTECILAAEAGGCWVRERSNVRVNDTTLSDHMGVFPVGIDTPVGVYRFRLEGRDARFRLLTAVSSNFTVNPTEVTRPLLTLPPATVVKGEAFTFYIELAPGDVVRDRIVVYRGAPTSLPPPQLAFEAGRLNVTYAVPYDALNGNYTLRLSGRDVNGNTIVVMTPPFEAQAASLQGRILGQPPKTLARGETARFLFGVTYPTGVFYAAQDTPRVVVNGPTGQQIAEATVRREGLSFAASWTPPQDATLGNYTFEVTGQAQRAVSGNVFPALRSTATRVVPGSIVRPPSDDMPPEVERLASASFGVPFDASDKFAGFELIYYGPSISGQVDTTGESLIEVTRSPLAHGIDPATRKYVARIETDQRTQTGTYRIAMTGRDGAGNEITSISRVFVIRPTQIGVSFNGFPDSEDFGEGKTTTWAFVVKYRVGPILEEKDGTPGAVILYNNRPVTQRPEVVHRNGVWYASWTAPETLPDGEYVLAIGGSDLQGNPISSSQSIPYVIQTDLGESFAKSVPGASPALLVLALAALALLLARKRSA